MIATSTPTWATTIFAIVTGGLGGTLLSTFVSDRRRRKELDLTRLLHKADARLQALKDVTSVALLYREQIAAALKLIVGDEFPSDAAPKWSWTSEDIIRYRILEAELSLLFGPRHEVVSKWRLCAYAFAQASEYVRDYETVDLPVASPKTHHDVRLHRDATWTHLQNFLDACAGSLDEIQPLSGA